jgi:small-conductance mechanosensitive channel
MDFLNYVLKEAQAFSGQNWVRDLALLFAVSLIAYLPGWLSARPLHRYQQSPRFADSRALRVALEIMEASLWPLWAILFYSAFGVWNHYSRAGGHPFQLIPILLFFLLYRMIRGITVELLPPGRRRRRIRKVMIPSVFLLITLQQVGALGPIFEWIGQPFMTIGSKAVSLLSILVAAGVMAAFVVLSRVAGSILRSRFLPGLGIQPALGESLAVLVRYVLIAIGIFAGLNTVGIDLSTLKIVLGALGVGIGFGLQGVVNNFVSGLIILIERRIKQGDIVTVGGTDGRVTGIGMRSSVVRTRRGLDIVVPNSDLVSQQVANFSYRDRLIRVDIPVGVSYAADPEKVRDILIQAAEEEKGVISYPPPTVVFTEYGDSSINFELRAWIDDPWEIPTVRSSLYFSIWYRLKEAGIEIPFPQRDLHFRSGEIPVALKPWRPEHEMPDLHPSPSEKDGGGEGFQERVIQKEERK